ncbi:uncharacterized protein B0I36DRAFT_26301 [Microdochium trichocladiopsis]|uniref:Uncharacterized protein n=1 Tax=Microdochium trichocladiopsis TaxID=1682393 RepID=A0A9P9BHT6_9PEZI|nr:uncharacterized protein B0I36DRAFT_26301 [Microdochium trichocladiopsis]KAH7020875.1 hypothetical protein B0I36DRAFT_26301 [Microdochium trichocladiopsis]
MYTSFIPWKVYPCSTAGTSCGPSLRLLALSSKNLLTTVREFGWLVLKSSSHVSSSHRAESATFCRLGSASVEGVPPRDRGFKWKEDKCRAPNGNFLSPPEGRDSLNLRVGATEYAGKLNQKMSRDEQQWNKRGNGRSRMYRLDGMRGGLYVLSNTGLCIAHNSAFGLTAQK